MIFIDELFGGTDSPSAEYRYTVNGSRGAYFECVKEVLGFSDKEIQLLVGKRLIFVSGEKLVIERYCAGDLVLNGKVNKVEVKSDA